MNKRDAGMLKLLGTTILHLQDISQTPDELLFCTNPNDWYVTSQMVIHMDFQTFYLHQGEGRQKYDERKDQ